MGGARLTLLFLLVAAAAAAWFGGQELQRQSGLVCRSAQYPVTATPEKWPADAWATVADPAALGWDPAALERAFAALRGVGAAAVMVVDDGRLVAARGCTQTRWSVALVRKSLMNAVIGRHVAAGRLSLDATLAELGIDETSPPLSAEQRATTVRELLTSSSGICRPSAAGASCVPAEAAARTTPFLYNNWDFNALLAVHQAVSERDFFAFFAEEIARPIGMASFDPVRDGRYRTIAASDFAGYETDMTAEDMARFGLLYLRGGSWDGQRILPADWVAESTSAQVATGLPDGSEAYGLLWWVQTGAQAAEFGLPPGSFSAEGNWMQAIQVIPSMNTVIVIRGYVPRLYLLGRPDRTRIKNAWRLLIAAKTGAATGQ